MILSACNKNGPTLRSPGENFPTKGALGLRHVGYGIPTELFGPFVSSAIEKIRLGKRRKELPYSPLKNYRDDIELPILGGTQTMQTYDKFEGFPLQNALFGLGIWWPWTNMSLKSSGLEDYFPCEMACFFGDMFVFGDVDGNRKHIHRVNFWFPC